MTNCNRCGEDFDNHYNGYHWCPNCGKVFQFDVNDSSNKKKY